MSTAIWSGTDSPYTCLKDPVRTEAFRRAIGLAVRPGDVVVEAGAGTGILSFFAAAAGARAVYAVEIDPGLIQALRMSVAVNGFADQIVVVPGDARSVDLPRDADVFIGELIETGLIDETQVSVMNTLRARGVIGPATRVIPERYTTLVDLVEVDDRFYGYHIVAPKHEWPNYARAEEGWLPTRVRPLTAPAVVAEIDLRCAVEPDIDAAIVLTGIADGQANAVRLSGTAGIGPNLSLGQTNALNGDKILTLRRPITVARRRHLRARVSYRMGGGLGSFVYRSVDDPPD